MESRDDVSVEGSLEVRCGDIFARDERVRSSYVGNQDVDLADFLEDGRDAVEVGDGSGVRRNFGALVSTFQSLLRFVKDFLASLDENEMLHAGFGEGLGDGETDATCLEEKVSRCPVGIKGELRTAASDQDRLSISIKSGRRLDAIISCSVIGLDLCGPKESHGRKVKSWRS